MGFDELSLSHQNTKDNLGSPDTNQVYVVFHNQEDIFLIELSTIIETRTIGTAFILNHSANGVLGTSILGSGTMGSQSVSKVTNPNNVFREYFFDTEFKEVSSTNANWDTANGRLSLE